jgi:hypothetical protein
MRNRIGRKRQQSSRNPRHYPRKELEEAAQYAIDLSNLFLQLFKIAGIPVQGALS